MGPEDHPRAPIISSDPGGRRPSFAGFALILGHADPGVVAAVGEQLAKGICFSMPTAAEIELASIVCERWYL